MPLSIALNTAKGDAYGIGFEYGSAEHVRKNNTLTGYVRNEKHFLEPGVYSDDTQRFIANAEVILGGSPLTREAFANAYVDCFKRDEREGYAKGYYQLLCEIKSGNELLTKLGEAKSDKSGGAMGAVICGILPSIAEVVSVATLQAAITHNTKDGINAALAAALMGHYFIYDLGAKKDLGTFLETHVKGDHCDWSTPWTKEVGSKGWESVHAAVSAVIKYDSLAEMLKACIGYVGDVDTVAAIAIGAASASREVVDDLPAWLFDDMENGTYGRDFLVTTLDKKIDARVAEYKAAKS